MTQSELKPIPMILYCPQCGQRHVDEPDERTGWTNPPHRSHLCHDCGCIWRPADVPTNGVAKISTRGAVDTWSAERGNAEAATPPPPSEPLVERVTNAILFAARDDGYDSPVDYGDAEGLARAALTALLAPAEGVVEALRKCRDKFREYEGIHTLKLRDYKGKEPLNYAAEIQFKINRNREMADMCDAALAKVKGDE